MKNTRMKKFSRRLGVVLAGAFLAMSFPPIVSQADSSYTYCYDYWGDVQYSPNAYEVSGVYTSADLGLETYLNTPGGLTVQGNYVYICDTGNNRIVQLERVDREKFKLVEIFDSIKGDVEVKTFNRPNDVQIDDEGNFYIADTGNARILKLDSQMNYIAEFSKPIDSTLDPELTFQPAKIAVDGAGRVYCVANGINKGLVKYEANTEFAGFIGATPVVFKWTDYIWKRLASQEQREKMENFVPTEYSDLYMDHDGFIYAVNATLDEDTVRNEEGDVVRRLNLMGSDILIRNGEYTVCGDLYMGSGGGYSGPSKITDVTAFENDVYVLLDKNRGRLFAYDNQGRLLYAFGGPSNENGCFRQAAAIDHMGYDLLVLDSLDRSITLFTPTEYGQLIFNAIDAFDDGEYALAGEIWQDVMDLNGNYDLAYIGVGRSLLRQERFEEAMEYFELKYDDDNYSKAFKQYRKAWVEEHILVIFIIVFAALLIPMAIGKISKIKHEIDTADIFRF